MRVAYIVGDRQYGCEVTFYKVTKISQTIPYIAEKLYRQYDEDEFIHFQNCDKTLKDKEHFKEWITDKLNTDINFFNDDPRWEIYNYVSIAKDEEWEKHFEYIESSPSKGPGNTFTFVDLTQLNCYPQLAQ